MSFGHDARTSSSVLLHSCPSIPGDRLQLQFVRLQPQIDRIHQAQKKQRRHLLVDIFSAFQTLFSVTMDTINTINTMNTYPDYTYLSSLVEVVGKTFNTFHCTCSKSFYFFSEFVRTLYNFASMVNVEICYHVKFFAICAVIFLDVYAQQLWPQRRFFIM